jgi:hypothetical protein
MPNNDDYYNDNIDKSLPKCLSCGINSALIPDIYCISCKLVSEPKEKINDALQPSILRKIRIN